MKTVQILRWDDKRISVQALAKYGPLAVTQYSDGYTVTHVRSGMAVVSGIPSLPVARKAMRHATPAASTGGPSPIRDRAASHLQ